VRCKTPLHNRFHPAGNQPPFHGPTIAKLCPRQMDHGLCVLQWSPFPHRAACVCYLAVQLLPATSRVNGQWWLTSTAKTNLPSSASSHDSRVASSGRSSNFTHAAPHINTLRAVVNCHPSSTIEWSSEIRSSLSSLDAIVDCAVDPVIFRQMCGLKCITTPIVCAGPVGCAMLWLPC
jgi:hypothetical protein